MYDHLAIFCAKFLIFIQAAIGFGIIARTLPLRRHLIRRRWLVSVVTMCAMAGLLSLVADFAYQDPRPFVSDGLPSLIPHTPNNGFPSDHALAAAALVAAVALLSPAGAVPLAGLAVMVDWGRVACHVHHTLDVVASSLIVLLATAVAVRLARQVRIVNRL